ncbi:hypothetical protein [Aliidiomarina quisquiliarum]|uniref:hypothetical protein n=1 Tax=Aliidiomarina quisquiliarum TaxID=2938947 RepID=UPI00208EEB22|nr:hypothetical protein [Aliidiomarina quisquiliarum]MCO4320021.1 hypothetical protein [Aliidiomarina quisquiliarum]
MKVTFKANAKTVDIIRCLLLAAGDSFNACLIMNSLEEVKPTQFIRDACRMRHGINEEGEFKATYFGWQTNSGSYLFVDARKGKVIINGTRRAIYDGLRKFVTRDGQQLLNGLEVIKYETSEPEWPIFFYCEMAVEEKLGQSVWDFIHTNCDHLAVMKGLGLTPKEESFVTGEQKRWLNDKTNKSSKSSFAGVFNTLWT